MDDETISNASSDTFNEEEAHLISSTGPTAATQLAETLKKYLALGIWLFILIPIVMDFLMMRLPSYFGIKLVVWSRYALLLVVTQALVRVVIFGILKWLRRSDEEKIIRGETGSVHGDLASYLEAIVVSLTSLLTTVVFALAWYSVYPLHCAVESAVAEVSSGIKLSDVVPTDVPAVDEATAAATIAINAIKASPKVGHLSVLLSEIFQDLCIYQVVTDIILCSIIINSVMALEIVVLKLGMWRFLRGNFLERILEARYRTYVVDCIRYRTAALNVVPEDRLHGTGSLPVAFPFLLPFDIPPFGRILAWLNAGLQGSGPRAFEALIAGRPLSYNEYRKKLNSWIQRQGLDEAVGSVLKAIPSNDGEAKQIVKELFPKIHGADRDYILDADLEPIFQGRAPTRDAYYIFDRDQDGTVSKTEFRHTIVTVYREMRNLANSVHDAGKAFMKLGDSVHLLVVLGLFFVCLTIFGVQVQSIFAIVLSLVLGLNVVIGDVAKRSFQGIIFLFIDHPYDVGDRVLVSALSEIDPLVVHQINMLTTVFHRWNGQEVYVPNANLATATIYNVSRSSEQWERVDFTVAVSEERGPDGRTTTSRLTLFRDKMEAFLKSNPTDYCAALDFKPIISGEVGKSEEFLDTLNMSLRVQCRPTVDSQKRWTRHSRLLSQIKQTLGSCGLNLQGKLKCPN